MRRRRFFALAGSAALVTAAGRCALGDAPATSEQELAELLEPIRKEHELPALAAAVVRGGETVAVAAVGVRKLGDEMAVTKDDRFHLGSCTKSMKATLDR